MAIGDAINSYTSGGAILKERYAKTLRDSVDTQTPLISRTDFMAAEKTGRFYNQPLRTRRETGITRGAAGTTPTLNGSRSGQIENAQIAGFQLIGQASIDYDLLSRANSAPSDSVKNSLEMIADDLVLSMTSEREELILHGGQNRGVTSAVAATSTTVSTLTITAASWAAGLWSMEEGKLLDLYNSAGTLLTSNANCQLEFADLDARTLRVSSTSTTDMAAVVSAGAGVTVWPKGGSPSIECAGLGAILGNTGTLFGISAATYSVMGGNIITSFGAPTLPKILAALAKPAAYVKKSKFTLVGSPALFEAVNSDQAALRRYGAAYRSASAENGFEGLMFHSQLGTLEIMPHPMQKDGQFYVYEDKELKRIGSQDIAFVKRSGKENGELILDSSTKSAAEMRAYSNEALFYPRPRGGLYVTGVTY